MMINFNVKAEVIDIVSDRPQRSDIFLVDTNVWIWQTYPNAKNSSKIREYGAYLKAVRQNGSTLAYSGLVLAELAHVIERTECEIYNKRNNFTKENKLEVKAKEFRHNYPSERSKVVKLLQTAWMQIQDFAVPLNELTIDESTTNAALARFQTQALDGYDLFILEAIHKANPGQVKVITDDMDYATVPNIQLFTSNIQVIKLAKAQGKLLRR
jgi:PIN domain